MGAMKNQRSDIAIARTKEAAAAFLQDVRHLRKLLQQPTREMATGVRHASVLVRRLLVEHDLHTVASPRVGRVHIASIDNSAFTKPAVRLAYFVTGGFDPFGIGVPPPFVQITCETSTGLVIDPNKRIKLTLEQFLSQKIVCLNNEWVRRVAMIKYVAINMSAAHIQSPPK
jgi:hypothetical protein